LIDRSICFRSTMIHAGPHQQVLQGWADLFPVGALFLMGASMHGAVSLADDRTYLFMVRVSMQWLVRNGCRVLHYPIGWVHQTPQPQPNQQQQHTSSRTPPIPKHTHTQQVVLVLAAKLLLVPLFAYLLVSALGGSTDLAILAFLVGAFPVGMFYALKHTYTYIYIHIYTHGYS
jgi:hypothetical protein